MSQLTIDQMPDTSRKLTISATGYTVWGASGIWLLFTGVQWALSLINQGISPATVQHYNRLWFVAAGLLTLVLVTRQRPTLFEFSTLRPRWNDLPIAAAVAYVDMNLTWLLLKPPFDLSRSDPLNMTITIGMLPVIEELLCRGVILRSLLERMHPVLAVLLSSAIFSLFHLQFWPAMVGQVLISLVYILRGKSLAASILTHVIDNALAWLPQLLITAHLRHIV